MDAQVLTVSTKGQISLPVEMRRQLSINTGDRLVAYAHGDTIMLKLPTVDEFDAMLKEAQSWAASVGYKEEDVNDIIKSYRKEKRGQA